MEEPDHQTPAGGHEGAGHYDMGMLEHRLSGSRTISSEPGAGAASGCFPVEGRTMTRFIKALLGSRGAARQPGVRRHGVRVVGDDAAPSRYGASSTAAAATGRCPVLVTGVIGDVGTVQTVNSSGKPDGKGNYFKLTLRKGTLTVNGTQFNAALERGGERNPPADYNSTTCTGSFTAGPAAGSGGERHGGVRRDQRLGGPHRPARNPAPKTKAGACNTGATPPRSDFGAW